MQAPMDDRSPPDRARFRTLYEQHARPLLGYALRRVVTSADAADVVAETFLVAWRRLDDLPGDDEMRPWLYGVARGVLANHRRGARRRSALTDKLRQHLANQVRLGSPTDASDTVASVRQAMTRLDEDDRELLQLVAWEGLTPTEIAVTLSIPAATVRTRLHRARHRLRAALTTDAAAPERNRPNGHVGAGERTLAPDAEVRR